MSARKPLSTTAAKYLLRSLFAPVRVTFKEDKPLAIFLGAAARAAYTGESWESIIQQANKDLYARTKVHSD